MKHPKRAHDPARQAALDAYDAKLKELHLNAWRELQVEVGGTAAGAHDFEGYKLDDKARAKALTETPPVPRADVRRAP